MAVILALLLAIPVSGGRKGSLLPVYEAGRGSLVLELSIGGDEDNVLFYEPTQVRVDEQGRIFVVDTRMPTITAFDSNGDRLLVIESVGQGPGDIATPTRLAFSPNGEVVVYDVGNRRFSTYSGTDGEFIGSANYPDLVWRFDIGPDGHAYIETRISDFQDTMGGALIRLSRLSSGFSEPTIVDSTQIKLNKHITKPVHTNVPVPFRPQFLWSLTPVGNLIVARSADYTIKMISPQLKTLREVKHSGKRLKVSDDDKERHFAGMTTSGNGMVSKGAPGYIRDATEFPTHKPYFKSMLVDHEGYVLIQTYETTTDGAVYDVFSPNLDFMNRVVLPDLDWSCVIVEGRIYQVHSTDDEFASVRRYRLE